MKRPQFSLSTLLITPLLLSPLLLSIREVLNLNADRGRQWGIEIALLAAAFPFALTFFMLARRKAKSSDSPLRLAFLGAIRGAIYGNVYFILLCLPLLIAEQIVTHAGTSFITRLTEFGKLVGSSGILGTMFGTPIGALAGMAVAWMSARKTSPSDEPGSPDNNPEDSQNNTP